MLYTLFCSFPENFQEDAQAGLVRKPDLVIIDACKRYGFAGATIAETVGIFNGKVERGFRVDLFSSANNPDNLRRQAQDVESFARDLCAEYGQNSVLMIGTETVGIDANGTSISGLVEAGDTGPGYAEAKAEHATESAKAAQAVFDNFVATLPFETDAEKAADMYRHARALPPPAPLRPFVDAYLAKNLTEEDRATVDAEFATLDS